MIYTFGKSFTFTYYPKDPNGTALTPSADNPTIYVYSARPSRDQAAAGTGDVVGSAITSWSTNGNGKNITIPSISDPDSASVTHTRAYYLALNYTLTASGTVLTDIIEFLVSRPIGYDNELSVTVADIEKYFVQVDDYLSEAQQGSLVTEAIAEVRGEFKDNGYDLALVRDPERLKYVVIQRVLYRTAIAQIAEGKDGFMELKEEAKAEYYSKLKKLVLEYDTDRDGATDTSVTLQDYAFINR